MKSMSYASIFLLSKAGSWYGIAMAHVYFSLIISDVPGDDVSVIASGPTVGDTSTFAMPMIFSAGIECLSSFAPKSFKRIYAKALQGEIKETPNPGDALFSSPDQYHHRQQCHGREAAAIKAEALGYTVVVNDTTDYRRCRRRSKKWVSFYATTKGKKPACLIQGGETTVKVTGNGKGGRNQHFVLAALNDYVHGAQRQ